MFLRVREAARRGRRKAKSLLITAGRGIKIGAYYFGLGALRVAEGALAVLRTTARLVTWTWMSAIEVVSITASPFMWILGNGLFALMRGLENLVNVFRDQKSTRVHNSFPSFTILNAVAMGNIALYPLLAIVGWLLSPLTRTNWWRYTAHGFKVRTLSAADFDYRARYSRDIAFDQTMGEEPEDSAATVWESATYTEEEFAEKVEKPLVEQRIAEQYEGHDAASWYQHMLGTGRVMVYRDPNEDDPAHQWDYMLARIREQNPGDESEVTEFLMGVTTDQWGRDWAWVPSGVSTQPPARVESPVAPPEEPEEELHAKHAADPYAGLTQFNINEPPDDYTELVDPKERSFWYGAQFAIQSRQKIKKFLTNTEQQNRARAMVAKDTKGPQSGFLQHYALMGFERELERMQEAESHRV